MEAAIVRAHGLWIISHKKGPNPMRSLLTFLPFVALVAIAATTGAQFMPGPWYAGLAKPSWTPPDWLFPVAWTVLYLMIDRKSVV